MSEFALPKAQNTPFDVDVSCEIWTDYLLFYCQLYNLEDMYAFECTVHTQYLS